MICIFKQKGDVESKNCRGIKLLEHVLKILDKRLRELVEVDQMQFGFRPGRGTTDASFMLRETDWTVDRLDMVTQTGVRTHGDTAGVRTHGDTASQDTW